jgi:hypothetical protein
MTEQAHRLTPLAILAVFLFAIPGIFVSGLFIESYDWLMHMTRVDTLVGWVPGRALEIVILIVPPSLSVESL